MGKLQFLGVAISGLPSVFVSYGIISAIPHYSALALVKIQIVRIHITRKIFWINFRAIQGPPVKKYLID